ncbi:MAG: hypothetical protein O7J95_17590, partial [Planctomycetota bacterium]|nr:hypothetical protein [Planctomycetota bacterium]
VRKDQLLRVARRRPRRVEDVTSAVCFGMPSMAPEVWRRDVARAKKRIRRGQVLVVSVVGTPGPGDGVDALAEDFARCAGWAARAGADVVEANYSCPNVCTPEGSVYQDPRTSRRLSEEIRAALPSTPFFIKAGHFETPARLRAFYRAVDGLADAVVLVNGVSRRVVRADGQPVFGPFERVGILGRAIHAPAVENVRRAARLSSSAGFRVETIAVGGVMQEADAGDFFAAGASAVLLGGVPMLDPLLADRAKRQNPGW